MNTWIEQAKGIATAHIDVPFLERLRDGKITHQEAYEQNDRAFLKRIG